MAKHLHHGVPGQLSQHINEAYPLFVDFLKGYYEWLEMEGSPYHLIRNHLSYMDFKDSIDVYIDMLKKEYLEGIPESVIADKELLIRYSKQFFGSIGTEKSFEFLFKILYGEDVDIYYPGDDILRASDGKWVSDETVIYLSDSGVVDSFLYRRIMQRREVIEGHFETSYATVNRIVKRYASGFVFAEVHVSDIDGQFYLDYPVTLADEMNDGNEEWMLPICSDIEIVDGGSGYLPGNVLTYAGANTFTINLISNAIGRVDARYVTNIQANDLEVTMNGNPLVGFTYDGRFIYHPSIIPGNNFTVKYPIYDGLIAITEVGPVGEIISARAIDIPFGMAEAQLYIGEDGGSGGSVRVKPSLTSAIPGYFSTNDGFLSDRKVLQDSDYYQDFSYVIKSSVSVEAYRDIVLKVLHPAGMKMFGEVNILELISLIIRDHSFDITFRNLDVVFDQSEVQLYNRTGFVDDWKNKFGSGFYFTGNFENMLVEDVVVTPDEPMNIHDSVFVMIQGDYFMEDYIEDPDDYIAASQGA